MDDIILNKLAQLELRFNELNAELSAGFSTVEKLKEYSKLQSILELKKQYDSAYEDAVEAKIMYNDPTADDEWKAACEEEYNTKKALAEKLEYELTDALIEKAPEDSCNAIFEISGEVGGEEANLFARDLYLMYIRYAESAGFKVDLIAYDESDLKGVNYASFKVIGDNAYGTFKFESGVHRVQRVPETEAKGRIHTSTASVMVVPELEVNAFELNLDDVEITPCHASGAGGQHINKTSSAIRAVYKPTGLTVFCQSRRSQQQNKDEALKILASRLKAEKLEKEAAESSANKASKLGTRDRSEKIRTYNYPQNRVTDHRIGYSTLQLDRVMLGDLEDILQALHIEARKEQQ